MNLYNDEEQPKALQFAEQLDADECADIADELRRLHAENEDFRATCDHLTRENAEHIGEIVALKEQRDELMEALATCRANFRRYEEQTLKMAQAEDEERASLRTQRDELLEALKDYDDAFTGFDPSSKESRHRMRQAVIKARSAIAKAGGAA